MKDNMKLPKNMSFETMLQHGGGEFRLGTGLVGATENSVTYRSEKVDGGAVYARLSNTLNHKEVEGLLASLHGAERALVFGSGMAAMSTLCLGILQPGSQILAQENCYGGNQWLLGDVLKRWGVGVTYAPIEAWEDILKKESSRKAFSLLYCESISNPFCVPQDVALAGNLAQKAGVPLLVDNTFASPALLRPLEMGATYVLESGTKYLNGHSDVVCGALFGKADAMMALSKVALCLGGFLPTQGCVQLMRGLRTLDLRMERHCQNAKHLANLFRSAPWVEQVWYGVSPDSAPSKFFRRGFGGMMALRFQPDVRISDKIEKLGFVQYVPSLAGTETTVTMPWFTTNAYNTDAERLRLGITRDVVRLSVGLENPDEIFHCFAEALAP
jgi:cystathionine beta-lyase/cystathionine gamma-synthase